MDNLTPLSNIQRNQRSAIRAAHLLSTVDELVQERDWMQRTGNAFGGQCLQEMIRECADGKASSYGDLPL